MTNKTKTPSGKDRRDFFRVSQDVYFDYKSVNSFTAGVEHPENEFDDAVSLTLINELKRLDKDNIQTLRLLTEKNRLLGDYLQTLSSKIDLIARHTLFSQEKITKDKKKTRINLSEDGIAFITDRAIYKDSFIAVRLIFLPNYAPVASFAKVIRCDAKKDKYQIAARFHRIADTDRKLLSKQILKTQATQRKTTKPVVS